MLTESSCTLYLKTGEGFERYVVPECHWQESLAANVLKSGLQNANGIVVYIPKKAMVLFPDGRLYPSSRLFPNMDISPKKPAQDIIIKGECDFVFDNSTPQTASGSLRELNSRFEVHTVMSVDRLLYGSDELQHYKISAR